MDLKSFDLSSATVKQVVSDGYHDVMYRVLVDIFRVQTVLE